MRRYRLKEHEATVHGVVDDVTTRNFSAHGIVVCVHSAQTKSYSLTVIQFTKVNEKDF